MKRMAFTVLMAALLLATGAGKPSLTLKIVEDNMVNGGYLDTLYAAYWAADQGEAVVPLLGKMLENRKLYEKRNMGATGAFPFNAIWALAHIPSPPAIKTLERFSSANDLDTSLAIVGWRLRRDMKDRSYGVMMGDATLYARADETSRAIQSVPSGCAVQILDTGFVNEKEVGARGGPVIYDFVRLIPIGPKGYIQRGGDDFTPFF